ncbi:hypothetical protein Mpop_1853 [Methylorubrum populi BJ001]|uniref:Uncharacterized protein n=1 Tax=Methylorubrum populi (strain ATCC BAA-705 / NCIMB 13946 / BJ001) TaxID=441620 RepID=B1ZJB1_METPB|nr:MULTISPECIES: hypothetical protein [Methylorubrum]ACB80016.1 hypothetical protein Mpop_1853 [Methylorubrum populi BJ001]
MLKTLLRFAGFSPPAPPPRPPSARWVAPKGKSSVAPVAPPPAPVVPVEDPAAAKRAWARDIAERQANRRFAEAVVVLTRAADRNVSWVDPVDLAWAGNVVPEDVHTYLRVRAYAGLQTRILGDDERGDPKRTAAYRAGLIRLAATDFEVWTTGLAAYDRAVADATARGASAPEAISVPTVVEDGIAKLAVEKIKRLADAAARRGGNASGGTPAGTPPGTPPVTPPTGTKKDRDDEEPTPDAPAGPRR